MNIKRKKKLICKNEGTIRIRHNEHIEFIIKDTNIAGIIVIKNTAKIIYNKEPKNSYYSLLYLIEERPIIRVILPLIVNSGR